MSEPVDPTALKAEIELRGFDTDCETGPKVPCHEWHHDDLRKWCDACVLRACLSLLRSQEPETKEESNGR